MKKLLLLFLFLFDFSFAGYKIVHNGQVHCTNQIKNYSTTQIQVYSRINTYQDWYWYTLEKESISSAETGYSGINNSCVRNASDFPISYDVYHELRDTNIDSEDSLLNQKLSLSQNIVDGMFVIETSTNDAPKCTDGRSHKRSNTDFTYYSPDGLDDLFVSDMSHITHVYYGGKYNKDLNKCIYPNEDTPIDLKSYFSNPSQQGYYGTIPPELTTLKSLFNSKNELPNQNSLENKFDIDTKSSSLNCNHSLYTLQEKLLCEMNAGLRKLNQESNPKYSLNNLISILITSNDKNAQDTNESIKSISAFEEVRLQKQKDTNTLLDTTVAKQNELNTTLANIETTLKGIETNTSGGIVSGGGSTGGTVTPEPSEPSESLNLDKYFKPDETVNIDDINTINDDTDSIISSLFSSFTDFKTNITDSVDSINNQLDGLKETIENPTNIFSKSTIVNCPVSYQADFSAFGIGKKTLTIDYCEFTSRLQPIVYFFTYVSLFLGLIFFSFRFIGVLL